MKAFLLGLGLSLGAALAQSATPATSTPATSTPASSTLPGGSVTLQFAPKPGTVVNYTLTQQSRVSFKDIEVEALPGKTLSPQQERERQQEEARLRAGLGTSAPPAPAVSGTLSMKALPLLADGSRVIDISEVISVSVGQGKAPKSITLKLRQTVHPDGHTDSVLQDASDPLVKKLGAGLNSVLGQVGNNFAGTESSLYGRPLAPGQSFQRTDKVDIGQYLGSMLSGADPNARASGSLTAITTTTYQGMDAGGQARIGSVAQFAPTTLTATIPKLGPLTYTVQGLQVDGQSLLRPDGLIASTSAHTTGSITLSVRDDPSKPYQTSFTLLLDQTTSLQQK